MFRIALLLVCIGLLGVSAVGAAEIDLSKALVIGSGPKTVIEFTDPDCPFCRKASKYFQSRPDVKRYVFFLPLPRHPKAKDKARYILSQADPVRAYHEVMGGSLDNVAAIPPPTQKGVRQLEEQVAIAKRAKIDSTPNFMISGRIIEGFELKKIEEALGPRQ